MVTRSTVLPLLVPTESIMASTSNPSETSPNTTCAASIYPAGGKGMRGELTGRAQSSRSQADAHVLAIEPRARVGGDEKLAAV
eukprot:scaffold6322_cov100-Isochrysis_galbana.AAC.2